ncbi:MAG TPA: S41 family peptidase [Gemmatimonadales bacterium]|jgi:carboxyl-terminal processing protease|nr:S41 family peptidase [Gemmatimonadales bacterium]
MRPARLLLVAAAIASIAAGAWVLRRGRLELPAPARIVGTRLFESVLSHVRSYSVDSLGDQELYRRAAAGVIDELDDPYAELLLPGHRGLVPDDAPGPEGLYLDRRDGLIVVVATAPGSPADSAGVRSGDRLIGVDSVLVDASRLELAIRRLGGLPGTRVSLRIRRRGVREALVLDLVRGPVPPGPAVEIRSLGGGLAWIRVHRVVTGLADTVWTRIGALRAAGLRGLALDLRGVVGGALGAGVGLADLFLGPGDRLASSRGRPAMASLTYTDSTAPRFDSLPLAVLVDAGTAGAAEAAAGALQDHDRAAVLGTPTFGRGVSRGTFPLGGGASLRLTTALWLTPSGREIQRRPLARDGDSLPRPRLKTDGGRIVLGGGGIIPDRLVADTGSGDSVLAEARNLLARAGSARGMLALLAGR